MSKTKLYDQANEEPTPRPTVKISSSTMSRDDAFVFGTRAAKQDYNFLREHGLDAFRAAKPFPRPTPLSLAVDQEVFHSKLLRDLTAVEARHEQARVGLVAGTVIAHELAEVVPIDSVATESLQGFAYLDSPIQETA